MDAHALRRQGWTISAIARHLGRDRKTIRAYLGGDSVAGVRTPSSQDSLAPFVAYLGRRLADDPHVWATALFDEVTTLGFDRSYPTFTRGLREHGLRPHCEPCASSRGRDHQVIDHPPGQEVQWDWLELPDPPGHWGLPAGGHAHLFVGALSSSGRWRAVLAEGEDHAHLVEALHQVSARLGGVPRRWRFDRMATVANPDSGRVTAAFAAVAKHYAVHVDLCPPRHGNRKGVVEKANHTAAQRWWRTLPDALTPAQAQASLDAFCARVGDTRRRMRDGAATTVGELAEAERLLLGPLPPAFPAVVTVKRVVSAQALVAFRGNFYSVPPGLAGSVLVITHRLGADTLDVATSGGTVLARHHRQADGAGVLVRDLVHVGNLEKVVLRQFDTRRPCNRKARRPPTVAALAEAEHLTGQRAGPPGRPVPDRDREVVVDLNVWAAAARRDDERRDDKQVAP